MKYLIIATVSGKEETKEAKDRVETLLRPVSGIVHKIKSADKILSEYWLKVAQQPFGWD